MVTECVRALAAGAITLVSSLSLALGIQLAPSSESAPAKRVVHESTPQVAEAVAPAVAPPPEAAPPAPQSKAPAGEPAPESGVPGEQVTAPVDQQPDSDARHSYLTRVLEHIPGDAGDSAQQAPTP